MAARRAMTATWRGCAIVPLAALALVFAVGTCGAETGQVKKSTPLTQREGVGLNPQPEPPSATRKRKRLKPGEIRGLNPQPEPPMPPPVR
ncbi:MAG: hypothetical protein F9K29_16880 [Hyphomicrobiaceae bacterium]|nr:MAG: hypothetical protein F9K29_16880 [Hyphomicrobiaceae bacterium]